MFASVPLVVLFSSLAAFIPSSFASEEAANVVLTKPFAGNSHSPLNRYTKARPHRRGLAKRCANTTEPAKDVETLASTGSGYKIVEQWSGSNFFDDWNFYDSSDPTHGLVDYVSESVATSNKLAYVSGGVAYMKVDSTSNLGSGQGRKSVRIASKKRFSGGLFIADIKHMPTGLATWPAFWTVGTNWPNHGEIDIIETINTNNQNQYTVHSAPGCQIDTSSTAPEGFRVSAISSSVGHTECGSSKSSNKGCAFVDDSTSSAGAPFNAAGGGTFAMEWTSDGIKIWSFPRGSEPSDIASQSPSPSNWSTKYLKAAWSSHSCDTTKYFQQHAVTFDITLCGDWAGNSYPGGKSKCQDYVKTGSHFTEAYWAINQVSVYQS